MTYDLNAQWARVLRRAKALKLSPGAVLPPDAPRVFAAAVDLVGARIQALQKAGLNWGVKDPKGTAGKFAERAALVGFEAAKDELLAAVALDPDAYFHPADLRVSWENCDVADSACFANVDADLAFETVDAFSSCWGARLYHLLAGLFRQCSFFLLGGKGMDGHAVYVNLSGDLLVHACLFNELGGQAVQVVNRQDKFKDGHPELENRPLTRAPRVAVVDCFIGNTGCYEVRGSYPISIADVGRPGFPCEVHVHGTTIACRWEQPWLSGKKAWARSRGGILVEGRGRAAHHNGLVEIRDNGVILQAPDRQALIAMNAERLVVVGNTFEVNDGGTPYVDLDRVQWDGDELIRPSGRVEWRGNKGNVHVRYRGQVLGPATGTYKCQDGKVTKHVV